jgi:prophage tail gpP-like protein
MAEQGEKTPLTIEFEDTGERFTEATRYEIQSAFLIEADYWTASVVSDDPVALRRMFTIGRPVRLLLKDRPQLIGRIGSTTGVAGNSGALEVSGLDYLGDLVAADVDKSVRVTNRMTLRDALLEGLGVFGITEIQTDLEAVTSARMGQIQYEEQLVDPPVKKYRDSFEPDTQAMIDALKPTTRNVAITEEVSELRPSKSGEGALQWAARVCARHGYTIQPGTKRSAIAITVPDYKSPVRYQFRRTRTGEGSNLEDGTATRDGDNIPSWVNVSGRFVNSQQQARGGFSGVSVSGDDSPSALRNTREGRRFVEASGMVTRRLKRSEKNEPPALYKPIYHTDDKAKNSTELEDSTRRMLADYTKKVFSYKAKAVGHIYLPSGATYAVNTLADVTDEIEDVADRLWISETKIGHTPGRGDYTEMSMILPGAFIL